jgi:hypothetical protein
MKYAKAFYFLASVGLVLLAFLFGLRMLAAIMAASEPVLDAIIHWMYEHAIAGGLFIGIAFLLWWFADVCDERDRKEKSR